MKRVIVTGATGAIGTALIDELLRKGIEVWAILREGSPRNKAIPDHPLLRKTYCSLSRLFELHNETSEGYDVFYHLAWAGTSAAERQNLRLQCENLRFSLDAVELANRFSCHTFIGAGSQAEYGRVEGALTAQTPTFPENGYGIAKLCAGQLCRERAHQLGMRFVWTRILSVYGPHDGAQSMIASAIEKLLKGERAPFTKGEQLWDYLYSADAAEAFYALGERGKDGNTYVLGSGQARPLSEYINLLAKSCHAEDKITLGALPYAEKQVMFLKADIAPLTQDTGWTPKTNFEEGIEKTVQWFNKTNKFRGGV